MSAAFPCKCTRLREIPPRRSRSCRCWMPFAKSEGHEEARRVHRRYSGDHPGHRDRVERPSGPVAHGRGELDDDTGNCAHTHAEEECADRRVEGRGADPSAQDRGRARYQAESGEPGQAGSGLGYARCTTAKGCDDRQPFGRVVDGEANDEEGPESKRTAGISVSYTHLRAHETVLD